MGRLDFQPLSESGLASSSQQRLDHSPASLVPDVTSAFDANYQVHAFPVEHTVRFRSVSVGFTCSIHVWLSFSPSFVEVNKQQHRDKGNKDHI